MIVLENRELVILTPPHTASGNLHRALCRPPFNGFWAIGPTPDGSGYDHHVTTVAEGWKNFRIALVVRHPLDRLIGLYEHHQEVAKQSGWQPVSWWHFVAMVLENNSDLSWFYKTTICDLVENQRIDMTIRFETLLDDLAVVLGQNVDIAPGWVAGRIPEAYHRQIGPCCSAEWWGRDDLQRFNYSSRIPAAP